MNGSALLGEDQNFGLDPYLAIHTEINGILVMAFLFSQAF